MMILAKETAPGFKSGVWADQLAAVWSHRNTKETGAMVSFLKIPGERKQARIGSYENDFLDQLVSIHVRKINQFYPRVNVV
jgi:hydroxyethylthiazole kinase-like sugar kinase family protein